MMHGQKKNVMSNM